MFLRLLRLVLVVIVAVFGQPALEASAQAIGHGSSQLIADQTKVIQDLTTKTDGLEKKLSDPDQDDAGLVDIRLQLEDISRAALTSALAFRQRLNDINNRIQVLGPPPAQGQPPEPAIVSNERGALTAEKAEINAVVASAQNLSIRVNGLVDKIAVMRSELFRSVITKHYDLTEALSPQA
ncbi:mechanosensitive ion channel family protein, partial [Mesorhizobium sp. M00.F.Ca.ET.149.01.1.1]